MFSKNNKSDRPAAKPGAPSILSAGLQVTGKLVTAGELQIDGEVEGDVAAGRLTIGEHAKVTGDIRAEQIIVQGEVCGNIRARSVQLAKTAKITGDITHESLSVETGAYIEGHCKHPDQREAGGNAKLHLAAEQGKTLPPSAFGDKTLS